MIKDIPNIDEFISKKPLVGFQCTRIEIEFSSNLKENIYQLAQLLESDGFTITIKRRFLWNWKLFLEIPIIEKFDEDVYKKIIGKFYMLASRTSVKLNRIGIFG